MCDESDSGSENGSGESDEEEMYEPSDPDESGGDEEAEISLTQELADLQDANRSEDAELILEPDEFDVDGAVAGCKRELTVQESEQKRQFEADLKLTSSTCSSCCFPEARNSSGRLMYTRVCRTLGERDSVLVPTTLALDLEFHRGTLHVFQGLDYSKTHQFTTLVNEGPGGTEQGGLTAEQILEKFEQDPQAKSMIIMTHCPLSVLFCWIDPATSERQYQFVHLSGEGDVPKPPQGVSSVTTRTLEAPQVLNLTCMTRVSKEGLERSALLSMCYLFFSLDAEAFLEKLKLVFEQLPTLNQKIGMRGVVRTHSSSSSTTGSVPAGSSRAAQRATKLAESLVEDVELAKTNDPVAMEALFVATRPLVRLNDLLYDEKTNKAGCRKLNIIHDSESKEGQENPERTARIAFGGVLRPGYGASRGNMYRSLALSMRYVVEGNGTGHVITKGLRSHTDQRWMYFHFPGSGVPLKSPVAVDASLATCFVSMRDFSKYLIANDMLSPNSDVRKVLHENYPREDELDGVHAAAEPFWNFPVVVVCNETLRYLRNPLDESVGYVYAATKEIEEALGSKGIEIDLQNITADYCFQRPQAKTVVCAKDVLSASVAEISPRPRGDIHVYMDFDSRRLFERYPDLSPVSVEVLGSGRSRPLQGFFELSDLSPYRGYHGDYSQDQLCLRNFHAADASVGFVLHTPFSHVQWKNTSVTVRELASGAGANDLMSSLVHSFKTYLQTTVGPRTFDTDCIGDVQHRYVLEGNPMQRQPGSSSLLTFSPEFYTRASCTVVVNSPNNYKVRPLGRPTTAAERIRVHALEETVKNALKCGRRYDPSRFVQFGLTVAGARYPGILQAPKDVETRILERVVHQIEQYRGEASDFRMTLEPDMFVIDAQAIPVYLQTLLAMDLDVLQGTLGDVELTHVRTFEQPRYRLGNSGHYLRDVDVSALEELPHHHVGSISVLNQTLGVPSYYTIEDLPDAIAGDTNFALPPPGEELFVEQQLSRASRRKFLVKWHQQKTLEVLERAFARPGDPRGPLPIGSRVVLPDMVQVLRATYRVGFREQDLLLALAQKKWLLPGQAVTLWRELNHGQGDSLVARLCLALPDCVTATTSSALRIYIKSDVSLAHLALAIDYCLSKCDCVSCVDSRADRRALLPTKQMRIEHENMLQAIQGMCCKLLDERFHSIFPLVGVVQCKGFIDGLCKEAQELALSSVVYARNDLPSSRFIGPVGVSVLKRVCPSDTHHFSKRKTVLWRESLLFVISDIKDSAIGLQPSAGKDTPQAMPKKRKNKSAKQEAGSSKKAKE